MQVINYPTKEIWDQLSTRPALDTKSLETLIKNVLLDVKSKGDAAIKKFALEFDKVDLDIIQVSNEEVKEAISLVPSRLKEAISLAKDNIEKFHMAQSETPLIIETQEGVECWRKSIPIERVGLYIPGGSAPLFSTILMLGVPAMIAGCREIVLCTPPNKEGKIHPAILYTAHLVGITKICKVGGGQAIGAMAFGTESVPQVYKIFGPGNQYVTKAKEMVQREGVAIDMPAGPSEVLVVADESCVPAFVAADLLSQAEHGGDSQVILLSDNELIIYKILEEVSIQLEKLPRVTQASAALENSRAILLSTIDECIAFSNLYAPEHLILASESAESWLDGIINAGSVFIGNYSCESAGDYASGTNHTLPTNGYARAYSGVSLDTFMKKVTFQKLSRKGIQNIGPAIEIMAEAEELFAHKNAVTLRLNYK